MNVADLSDLIAAEVADALAGDGDLYEIARTAYTTAYEDLGAGSMEGDAWFISSIEPALEATVPDGTDEQAARVATVIATAAVNAATIAAAEPDTEFQWVTMQDDAVRDIHRPLHGEVRAAGEPFVVAGESLLYPGQPVGPPEVWINCRCSLQMQQLAASSNEPAPNVGASDEAPSSLEAAPANTHDGPGWLKNPRDTQRLRDYWTKGAGAAKIRWGTPGDLTRCEKHLRKYVGPQYAWGTCQNLHHVVFGFFNPESKGRHAGGEPDEIINAIDAAFLAAAQEDTVNQTIGSHNHSINAAHNHSIDTTGIVMNPTLTAAAPSFAPPAEWFADPGFDAPTPLTITSDGRVLGHLAAWETCHVGFEGQCITPPRSKTGYAHFTTGEVETADGTLVAVGQITMDTGHAGKDDAPGPAVSHYDNTGTGVADVAAGEDEFGIWVAGAMRPGVSDNQLYALKATGALSGDWRRIGGNLELVAALAVNVPGFPIPKTAMAASITGQQLSLVAAAVVSVDPNALDAERVAVAVLTKLDEREAATARRVRAQALLAATNTLRVEALAAAVR